MKEIKIFVLILLSTCLLVGCEKKEEIEIEGEKIDTKEMVHEHCSRTGTLEGGEAELNYDIYYTGEVLNILRSEEKVKSSTSSILDEYEEAYKSIKDQYKGLRYYDVTVTRDGNSVIYDTVINYEKIDMDKLREIEPEIEGQADIYKNNKLMLKTWWEFSKDMGMTCKGV